MKGQYWKKSKNLLKAACLSAALVTAWGAGTAPPAVADEATYSISGNVNPSQAVTNAKLIITYFQGGSTAPHFKVDSLGDLGPGSQNLTPFNLITSDLDLVRYTILGVYPTNNVTVGMNSTAATDVISNKTWAGYFIDYFINLDPPQTNPYTQDNLVSWLTGLNLDDPGPNLQSFFDIYGARPILPPNQLDPAVFGQALGAQVTLVNFPVGSNGTDGGTATVEAKLVPLPPTLFLMVPSLGVAFLLRRRKESD